jgi:6-phosphofructokinase 2
MICRKAETGGSAAVWVMEGGATGAARREAGRMPRILTVTLNPALDVATEVDRLEPEAKMRCAAPRHDPGGGGVNVSRAIARLGGTSTAFVALGGAVGAQHRALLAAEGLDVLPFDIPGETRQSFMVTERGTGRTYRFVLPGPAWDADTVEAALARLAGLPAGDGLLVLSGSVPPGVPDDHAARLSARLADRGWRLVLDVSGPALRAAASGAGAGAHVLRMDRREAGTLLGTDGPDAAAAAGLGRRLVEAGAARIVTIGLGAEGALAVTADGAWRVVPPPVRVVSATGAGDSFVAGFVLGLGEGWPVPLCLARAMAAATSAVTTPATALCTAEGTAAALARIVPERCDA